MAKLVTLAQAKRHLNVDHDDANTLIDQQIIQSSDVILRALGGRRIPVVTIYASTGIATVTTATAHGLSSTDVVNIWGAVQREYNGAVVATVTSATTFTYPLAGTPVSPATGTIGLSVAETWTDQTVPSPVQSGVLLLLLHLYEHRGDDMGPDAALWTAIDRLLVTYKSVALA